MGLLVLQRVDVLREELPQGVARGRGRGSRAHRGAERLHRRRRRLHPSGARLRDRPGARAPRRAQEVLPRNAVRRAASPSGGFQVLEAARSRVHVPRRGGARRGGAQAAPQARDSKREPPGAGGRALARHHGRRQHHRGPRLGRAAICHRARVGAQPPRDRPPHRQHALSGHGELVHRVTPACVSRLSALRRAARGAADTATASALLRRAGADAGRDQQEAPRLGRAPRGGGDRRAPDAAGSDQLRAKPLEVQPRVLGRPAVR